MASYIHLPTMIDGQDCNPTPQQRAVYSYHEALDSDAADDIYSFEWFERTRFFSEQFAKQDVAHVTTLTTWEMVEDLDFGSFFLAYPVEAYSLWHFLQACYELDRVVCGSSQEELRLVEKWESLKPFVYMRSKKVRAKWSKSLKHLKKEIECGALHGDVLVQTLYNILCGVERLQNFSAALADNFSVNLKDMKFVDKMLDKVADTVEDRSSMIANILKLEDSQETSRQEAEDSSDEALGDSTYSLQSKPCEEPPVISSSQMTGLRKKPKRQTSLPKPAKDKTKISSLKPPEAKNIEPKYNLPGIPLKFHLYALLVSGLVMCVLIWWQMFSITDTLSSTLCELDRGFGLYNKPLALCSNI